MTALRLSRLHVVAGVREEAGPRVGQYVYRGALDAVVDSRRVQTAREFRRQRAIGPSLTLMHADGVQDDALSA
jgi:hypothetical protein